MDGLILAAGRGSRLEAITRTLPKALIKVGGVSILERQILALIEFGVERIFIVVGYKAQLIKDFVSKKTFPIEIIPVDNPEWASSNNMFSFTLGAQQIKKSALIMNGDICIDVGILRNFTNCQMSSVGIFHEKFAEESMKVVINNGLVQELSKNIAQEISDIISADIFFFHEEDLQILLKNSHQYLENVGKNDWFEEAINMCTLGGLINLGTINLRDENWIEIDNAQDLYQADQLFFKKKDFLNHDNFYFDIDGTLLLDHTPTKCALNLLNVLSDSDKSIYAISNNTSLTVTEISNIFQDLGFPIPNDNIFTPIKSLEKFLINSNYQHPFFLGETIFQEYFMDMGFSSDNGRYDLIVISNDLNVTSSKIAEVARLVKQGTPYLVTHSDKVRPTENGIYPDAGIWSIVIQEMTGIGPILILGKPEITIFSDLPRPKSILIGDRFETDMELGRRAQMSTALVLTGISNRIDYELNHDKVDFMLNDFCGF